MKHTLEIDPEIRGLLEEIAADPRSAIRLAPRRALRHWFDHAEPARTRDVASTSAERHLIEAYREEVAELLLDAAEIAYRKAAVYFHTPLDAAGRPVGPRTSEPIWRERASRTVGLLDLDEARLMGGCLEAVPAELAYSLATASLSLRPSIQGRVFVATFVPWSQARLSLHLVDRLLTSCPPRWAAPMLRQRAARLCELGLAEDARAVYQQAAELPSGSPIDRCYAFNLSCFLGDERAAELQAAALAEQASSADPRIAQARDIVATWISSRSPTARATARQVIANLADDLPEIVRPISEVISA